MIKETFEVSKKAPHRTRYDVLASLMEEVGELSTEVSIVEDYSSKLSGEDGVIGEAIDVIICALDMVYIDTPVGMKTEDIEDVITRIVKRKLEKWKAKF